MSLVSYNARPPWLRKLPRVHEGVESSRENVLSRAIESSDEAALSLLDGWGVGVLAGLKTDSVSDIHCYIQLHTGTLCICYLHAARTGCYPCGSGVQEIWHSYSTVEEESH